MVNIIFMVHLEGIQFPLEIVTFHFNAPNVINIPELPGTFPSVFLQGVAP